MTIDYQLTLEYTLQSGWLEPFVRGLQQGIATARRCTSCEKTSYPPIRVCKCNHTGGEWVRLSGEAHIVHRCDGSEGSFALVQFIGADTRTVVRLENMPEPDAIGYLKSPLTKNANDKPVLVLTTDQQDKARR